MLLVYGPPKALKVKDKIFWLFCKIECFRIGRSEKTHWEVHCRVLQKDRWDLER